MVRGKWLCATAAEGAGLIAIIAALPREVASLVGASKPDGSLRSQGIWLYRLERAVVVAGGMGTQRATLAVAAAMSAASIDLLVSAGLAGACDGHLRAGEVAEAHLVVDTAAGERWMSDASGGVTLATGASIADVQEKARLAATYGAAMVDMEAAAIARMAIAHGLPFRAIKAISDDADFELPALARFAGKHGTFRTGAFALHTALRPKLWAKAAQLGKDSNRALAGLTEALRRLTLS